MAASYHFGGSRFEVDYEVRAALEKCIVWFAAVCVGTIMGVVLNLTLLARHHQVSFETLHQDIVRRLIKAPAPDGISPTFRQSSQLTCGAAAVTYLLTILGDFVFEAEFVNQVEMADSSNGYSFTEMISFIHSRGFASEAYHSSAEDLPKPGDVPVVAHLMRGHFVIVHYLDGDRILIFDPAVGRRLFFPLSEFVEEWSGKVLEIKTRDL